MKIVVTGALGHIGSKLIRDLPIFIPGCKIVLLDNLLTQRYCSLFNLPTEGGYRFLPSDILASDLPALFRGADAVVHLAAITDAANSFGNAAQVEEVNYHGTQKVAEACAREKCNLIFLSTTSVYGTQNETVDENCSASDLKPQSPYAESKLKAENLLKSLGQEIGLRFVILRFGTIFGTSPGMRFHTAVNKFVWQACLGEPITVWRTALNQKRPYLDLGDACRALCQIIRSNHFPNEIYNVVTANYTVQEIVSQIQAHIADLKVEFVDTKIMNQLSYSVSAEKFKKTGFEFKGNLAEGIQNSIQLLRKIRDTIPPVETAPDQ